MAATSIEWTDATWNPLRGCTEISPGCARCYAATMAYRFSGPGQPYEGLVRKLPNGKVVWTGKVRLAAEKLDEPLRWRKPRRVFVNSMSDLFHEAVPDEFILQVYGVMIATPWHTYQILTKRAGRLPEFHAWWREKASKVRYLDPHIGVAQDAIKGLSADWKRANDYYLTHCDQSDRGVCDTPVPWPPPNCWLGVSVEDQARADERLPHLLRTPAAVRFLSVEPMLGPINIRGHVLEFSAGDPARCVCGHGHGFSRCPNTGGVSSTCHISGCVCSGFRRAQGNGLHWVIVGGESGSQARPCDLAWIRSIRDQCWAAGVACFVKQIGARPRAELAGQMRDYTCRDPKGGDPAEWPEDMRIRELPVIGQAAGRVS